MNITPGVGSVEEALQDEQSQARRFFQAEKPIGSKSSLYMPLSILENPSVRSERMILLAEAYAIYGALFLNCVWFIWDYGISKDFEDKNLERFFEAACALTMYTTICISLAGMFLWIFAIVGASDPNFVYRFRVYLSDLESLAVVVMLISAWTAMIAIWNRLEGPSIESIVVLVLCLGFPIFRLGPVNNCAFQEQFPLEYFHLPIWFKLLYFIQPLMKKGVSGIKVEAQQRAEILRGKLDIVENEYGGNMKEVSCLLKDAAGNIGKSNVDLKPLLAKLHQDWLDTVKQLEGMDVNALCIYMPRGLAQEVFEKLQKKQRDQGNGS